MCNKRALRHGCGHIMSRTISNCRGTYAQPDSSAPLCHASPSLMVTVDEDCHTCQYKSFRRGWESRIADAQDNFRTAGRLSSGFQDNSSSSFGSEFDGASDAGFPSDAVLFKRQSQIAEAEVTRLRRQYERELWSKWSSFMSPRESGPPSASKKRRQRAVSNPRFPGSSPLKAVTSSDDLPSPLPNPHAQTMGIYRKGSESSDGSETSSGTASPVSLDSEIEQRDLFQPGWTSELNACLDEVAEEEEWLPNWGPA